MSLSGLFSEGEDQGVSSPTASQFPASDDVTNPSTIKFIQMKEYSNVNKITDCDQLTDEKWHE
jgi:hypothetical protein